MNSKDREKNSQTIHRVYKDIEGNTHTEYKDAQGNIHSYQNEYIDGKLAEEQLLEVKVERADKNISKGVLIGVIITFVAGLTAGTIYFLTKQNNPGTVSFINVPTHESTIAPSPPPAQVRIVERPIVKIVTIPQSPHPTENKTPQSSIKHSSPSASVSPSNTSSPNRTDSDIKDEISKQFQKNLPNNQLIVEVTNGEVTVSGTAETPEQLQQIEPLLKPIQGIIKVNMTATVALEK